jgi:Holliday junction DNA helicase RuvB
MIHEGLLEIVGHHAEDARFVNREKKPLDDAVVAESLLAALRVAPPSGTAPAAEAVVRLEEVPDVVDGRWWRRHAHLVQFGSRGLEWTPGSPLLEGEPTADDSAQEAPTPCEDALRVAFARIVGQEALVARLEAAAAGSAARGKPLPHVLLSGPPGTGKTTIAEALAASVGRRVVKATGALLQDVGQLLRLVGDLREGDVLFLEEAHAIPRPVLEVLYEAMAERRVSLTLHAGPHARAVTLALAPFTLVAATTEDGDLPAPFVSRFGLRESLGFYSSGALAAVAREGARAHGVELEPDAAGRLADLARGTPREALRLLDRAIDDVARAGLAAVTAGGVETMATRLGFDAEGLLPLERRYLQLLRASRTPISLSRMARLLGTGIRALLRDVEPWLFRRGLIEVTPLGRAAVHRPTLLRTPGVRGCGGSP